MGNKLELPTSNPVDIIGVSMDILKQKKTEEKLKKNEQHFRLLSESLPIGIFEMGEKGRLIYTNIRWRKIFGVTLKKSLRMNIQQIFPAKVRETFWKECSAAMKDLSEFSKEFPIHASKGKTRWVDFHLTSFISDYDIVNIGTVEEITDRKKTEDKLKKAFQKIKIHEKKLEMVNDHLDSFAYSVSHDLRAPLRVISGFSQVLLDRYRVNADVEMQHYLDRISEGAQKMGQLIDDLLYFSRATRSEIKYEKVDVEKIVNDIVKAHKGLAKNVEFIVNPLGRVEADEQMIKIVFVNLLQNAVKYTYKCKNPYIEIGDEQKRGKIQFFVKDNGIGFDMRYKDKLFEAFQRLHTDEEFEGSGIGLATVKRIVSKHGGKVWAEGEVGKGATFYFTLPVKAKKEE